MKSPDSNRPDLPAENLLKTILLHFGLMTFVIVSLVACLVYVPRLSPWIFVIPALVFVAWVLTRGNPTEAEREVFWRCPRCQEFSQSPRRCQHCSTLRPDPPE